MTTVDATTFTGTASRLESVEWELLDQGLSSIGTIHPTGEEPPRITNDVTADVKRMLRGLRLPEDVWRDIDTSSNRIRPRWVFGDGTKWPLGVFLFIDDAYRRGTGYYDLDADLADQTYILDQGILRSAGFRRGYRRTTAMADILGRFNVAISDVVDLTDALSAAAAWPPGTRGTSILDTLASGAAILSPYFDNNGAGHVEASPDIDLLEPDFTYGPGTIVTRDSIVEADNLLDAPNVFLVTDTSASSSPILGRFDVPAAYPHSIARRGFPVVAEIKRQGVESNASALTAARAAALQDPRSFRQVSVETPVNPRHDTFDVIEWEGENFREIRWEITCETGGKMTHDWSRVEVGE